jgi:hypothetical protein
MPRSTHAQKACRLNAAFDLLAHGCAVARAAAMLAEEFGLSQRQSRRYVQAAQSIKRPMALGAPSVPITVKVPEDVAMRLRAHARTTQTTMGDVVSRAVLALLAREYRRG